MFKLKNMGINQKEDLVVGNVIVRKFSFVRVMGLVLIGIILGSAITGALFLFLAKKVETNTPIAPQANQNDQSVASGHKFSNVEEYLNSIEVTNFSGVVTAAESNSISVKTSFFGNEKTYKVLIDKNTKISKREIKQSLSKSEDPNLLYSETQAKMSDINKGNGVIVDFSENIKDKTEFVAKSIMFFNFPPLPPASP